MEDLVASFWRDRRVFLTGHTGFKGGWLALWLSQMGAQVRGYSLDPVEGPNFFTSAKVGEAVEDLRGDLRDSASLERAIQEFQPTIVFHLAAQPLVRRSYIDPIGTYSTNVMGTANVLESIRKTSSVRAALVITTDKCYLNREWHWGYRESDPLGGYDPYSSSKACVEILTASYRSSFFAPDKFESHGVALATARAGNVIGGGDWSEGRLIPDLIKGFMSNETVRVRAPLAVRPWQHVLEPLSGYISLAEHLVQGDIRFADAWNFGPWDEDAWSVGQIAKELAHRWGGEASWAAEEAERVHEAGYLKLDSSKARAELGWLPRLRLQTGLDWLVAWHRNWHIGSDMNTFTLHQIASYRKMIAVPDGGLPTAEDPFFTTSL